MSVQLDSVAAENVRARASWVNDEQEEFVAAGTSQKISIFGLGYVGAVSLACLARDGHDMTGVDIDPGKLSLLRSGQAPIVETGIQELTRSVIEGGRST